MAMKSSRDIERIVGQARLNADRTSDARILSDAGAALGTSTKGDPLASRPGPTIWRTIMGSKATRYSAAAVVTLAVALVLLSPFGSSKNGGIVWAEVVGKVHQMNTVIHKQECVFWEMDEEGIRLEAGTATFDVINYGSAERGFVEHVFDEEGTLLAKVYFLTETQQGIMVGPTLKKYGKLSLPEDWLSHIAGVLTPRGMVDYFTSGHYTELGRAKLDNFDVEGFEITQASDPNHLPIPEPLRLLFPAKDMVARVWVDVETSLPVGFDFEFNTDRGVLTGFNKLRGEFRAYDFQWNAELPEGIFEPNIPDDYTEVKKVTDFIPAEARGGLVGLGVIPTISVIVYRRLRRQRGAFTSVPCVGSID
jgi:hypothetical protein